MASKNIGLCPQGFESPGCRLSLESAQALGFMRAGLARRRCQTAKEAANLFACGSKRHTNSATGTRTRVARVRAEHPNQLDYSGAAAWRNIKDIVCEMTPATERETKFSSIKSHTDGPRTPVVASLVMRLFACAT